MLDIVTGVVEHLEDAGDGISTAGGPTTAAAESHGWISWNNWWRESSIAVGLQARASEYRHAPCRIYIETEEGD